MRFHLIAKQQNTGFVLTLYFLPQRKFASPLEFSDHLKRSNKAAQHKVRAEIGAEFKFDLIGRSLYGEQAFQYHAKSGYFRAVYDQ